VPVSNERVFAVRAVGGMIAPLAVVDQVAEIAQVVAVVLDGAGHKLVRLGRCEGGAFLEHSAQLHQEEMGHKR